MEQGTQREHRACRGISPTYPQALNRLENTEAKVTIMILTALALLFALALLAGAVMLFDCAVRGRNAYEALVSERSRLEGETRMVTVTQLVPRVATAANSGTMPVLLRAAA